MKSRDYGKADKLFLLDYANFTANIQTQKFLKGQKYSYEFPSLYLINVVLPFVNV